MYDECKEGVSMVRRGPGGGGVEWCLMVLLGEVTSLVRSKTPEYTHT